MVKKNVNTNLVIVLLVLIGLLGYALFAQAGNLEPSAAPAPTMKTLQEVYDAASSGINEREGFCQYFEIPADSNQVVLTVPTGKCFVLLKLNAFIEGQTTSVDWSLTVDNSLLINGHFGTTLSKYEPTFGNRIIFQYTHDFPDRCLVLNARETLKAVNSHSSSPLHVTLIGYYYDIQ